jgi:chromosome segregation ATPase
MVTVDADMLTLQAEILTLETEKLTLDRELPTLEGQHTVILDDIKKKETAIPAKEREIGQVKQNIIENKEALQILNKKNKETTRKYTETFNMANRDRYSVQQDPNEDDQEYINRIKKIETATYDPNILNKKKKKINVLVKECFRAVLLKPVEGMRDRWSG